MSIMTQNIADTDTKWLFLREHLYYNENNELIAKKVIYNSPDGKKPIWYRLEHGEWIKSLNDTIKPQIPLYHIPELLNANLRAMNDEPLFFTEGEKDCDTVEKLGFVATTGRNGGRNFPHYEDIYKFILPFQFVFILIDNDETGVAYGRDGLKILTPHIENVFIIDTSEIFDYITDKPSTAILAEHADITDLAEQFGADNTLVALKQVIYERYRFGNNEKYEDWLKLSSEEDIKQSKLDLISYISAEEATIACKKYYKSKFVNKDNGETKWRILPIFAIANKKNIIRIESPYLYKFFEFSERYMLVRNDANSSMLKYIYRHGYYNLVTDKEIKGIMHHYVEKFCRIKSKPKAIDEAYERLERTDKFYNTDDINIDENIINFKNGILHLDTMKLTPHNPKYLTTIQIPCKWSGKPTATPNFDRYIQTLTSNDTDVQTLLLEFMGACLSNVYGYRFKKSLFIVGKGDSGKSVLLMLIARLLGKNNYSQRDLKKLNERFGETAVYLKRLVFSADLPFLKIDDMDKFKELTGGDNISIEFKGKTPFNYHYLGLLWFTMNNAPLFGGDKGKHVYERIMIVKCDNVIPKEQQDATLIEKLYNEREGIVYKCILALKDAIKRNYRFIEPASVLANRMEYMRENSQPLEFWHECMTERHYGETEKSTVTEVYNAFCNWHIQHGNKFALSMKEFKKDISSAFGQSDKEMTQEVHKGTIFIKFKLNEKGLSYIKNN